MFPLQPKIPDGVDAEGEEEEDIAPHDDSEVVVELQEWRVGWESGDFDYFIVAVDFNELVDGQYADGDHG